MFKVMFIETGMGIDLHGQDVTVACVRAARDAIGRNSMPGLRSVLPGNDLHQMKVRVTLGVPFRQEEVDIEQVKAVFPYGQVSVVVKPGGLLASSGVILPEKGDTTDEMVIVNAVVEVGYETEDV
jgi:uncharacterized protein (TIGR02058 family)